MEENLLDVEMIWKEVLEQASAIVPDGTPKLWLDTCVPLYARGGVLAVEAPNVFARDAVEKRLAGPLSEFLRSRGYAERLEISIGTGAAKDEPQPITPRFTAGTRNGLNPNYTFDSFVVGNSNKLAYAAAESVSRSPGDASQNPLFIWGGVGLGKTHLMHAIAHQILATNPDAKILYVSSEKFTNDLVASIQSRSQADFKTRYRSLDVLLIDDIQFMGDKGGTQEEFFHTFNSLREDFRQIVISSDRPPSELKGIEERLISRFNGGLSTYIQQPDYETRLAIIEKKAEMKGIEIPAEVISYIAENIPRNIREIEGALNRVVNNSRTTGEPMSPDNLAIWLKDVIRHSEPGNASIDQIMQLAAESFRVTVEDLISQKRTGDISMARQIAMYLAREVGGMSYPQIQTAFNKKDHTTVMSAYKKVDKLIKKDARTKMIVENIKNKLQA